MNFEEEKKEMGWRRRNWGARWGELIEGLSVELKRGSLIARHKLTGDDLKALALAEAAKVMSHDKISTSVGGAEANPHGNAVAAAQESFMLFRKIL